MDHGHDTKVAMIVQTCALHLSYVYSTVYIYMCDMYTIYGAHESIGINIHLS